MPENNPIPESLEIRVPQDVAIQVKIMEFDRMIADAEAQVAVIKQQKMAFILDSSIKALQNKYQAKPTIN